MRQNRDARSLLDVGLLFITEPNIRTVHILLQKFARIAIKKTTLFWYLFVLTLELMDLSDCTCIKSSVQYF